jgi:FlaG/FlaF family flagellin (archaellin)
MKTERITKGNTTMRLHNELAVSPVVGVMLMLVVTIIIAAVVSAFGGGLIGGNTQKTPQLTVDTRIANGGYWSNSFFAMTVTGEDQAIATKNLKIVTSWNKVLPNGTSIIGGATTVPGTYNFHVFYQVQKNTGSTAGDDWYAVMPLGYGPGAVTLNGTAASTNFWPWDMIDTSKCAISNDCRFTDVNGVALANNSWFGHYSLQIGTVMLAHPFGVAYGNTPTQSAGTSTGLGTGMNGYVGSHPTIYDVGYGIKSNTTLGNYGGGQYYYAYGNSYIAHPGTTLTTPAATFFQSVGLTAGSQTEDAMMGMLGGNWNYLRSGDTVNVKIIYTPTGKTIVNKDVTVEG